VYNLEYGKRDVNYVPKCMDKSFWNIPEEMPTFWNIRRRESAKWLYMVITEPAPGSSILTGEFRRYSNTVRNTKWN